MAIAMISTVAIKAATTPPTMLATESPPPGLATGGVVVSKVGPTCSVVQNIRYYQHAISLK